MSTMIMAIHWVIIRINKVPTINVIYITVSVVINSVISYLSRIIPNISF